MRKRVGLHNIQYQTYSWLSFCLLVGRLAGRGGWRGGLYCSTIPVSSERQLQGALRPSVVRPRLFDAFHQTLQFRNPFGVASHA